MSYIEIDNLLNYEAEYRQYLQKVKTSQGKIVSLCPFHSDKNPSFSVNTINGNYKCFSCGEEGNYITFRSKIQNVSTDEAYKMILDQLGIKPEKKEPEKASKYTIENYSIEKYLSTQYLVEQWHIDNNRDGIKIPYYNDQQEIKAVRFRRAGKKFTWGKETKIIPYGLDKLEKIKKKAFVILVEGESDTQTLWFYDIPALGIAGASIFQEEWCEYLKGLKIYIHHEGDQGADTFVKKVCEALDRKHFDGEVFKIKCKTVNVKDPSELHISEQKNGMLQFEKKWQEIMEQAEKLNVQQIANDIPELIKDAPIRLRQPKGWKIKETGIFKIDEKTSLEVLVIKTPILLLNRIYSLDTGEEKIEIAYYRDQKWHTAIFPRSVIFYAKNIGVLSDLGIMITSENAKDVIKFLGVLENDNVDLIKVQKSVSQLGWYDNVFLPCDQSKLRLDIHYSTQKWIDAYKAQGTLEEWIEVMKPYREENNIFRFLMASSFATPLLRFLNQRIFFLHNWAGSRSGKTACLRASLSVWGNPEELSTNFNATKVGLERIAGFFNDLPLGIDEKQVVGNKNQDFLESLVYMLGLGESKLRGNKSGGLQSMKSWRTIVMTTGEEPLTTMTSQTGVATRVLEIYGSPFKDEKRAREIYDVTQNYYGTAGSEFIKKFLKNFDGKYTDLRNRHKKIVLELEKDMGSKISSHISAVATVVLADQLIGEWLFDDKDQELSYKIALEILDQLGNSEETDIVEKGYEYLKSWCYSNRMSFDNFAKPSYGFIGSNGSTYYILPHIVENELTNKGFNYKKMLRGFSEKGYLHTIENTQSLQVQIRSNGVRVRYIALKISESKAENPFVEEKQEDKEDKKDDSKFIYLQKSLFNA